MGPRPGGRGKALHPSMALAIFSRFNGAAPGGARKGGQRFRLRHRPRASMGPRPGGRGKAVLIGIPLGVHRASMGPRPGGRGKAAGLFVHAGRTYSFNGAAPGGARKGGPARYQSNGPHSFNGAAPGGARKAHTATSFQYFRTPLQWGRARGGAERAGVQYYDAACKRLQWGRARGGAESAVTICCCVSR